MVERIRISNPTKIDIKAKFRILSPEAAAAATDKRPKSGGKDKGKAPPGKGKGPPSLPPSHSYIDRSQQTILTSHCAISGALEASVTTGAFTVQPERWEIPPHEHRFVNIYFNPTEIKSYRSIFLAEIDDEGIQTSAASEVANAGSALKFDLGGSGTLPCIGFESPTERNAAGNLSIHFGKVLLERSNRKRIVLSNDGVMPATCLFTMTGDGRDFLFPSNGSSLTVQPGAKEEIFVTFAPSAVGPDETKTAQVKIAVLHNPFDLYLLDLVGVAYTCDAVIDTILRDGSEEEEEEKQGKEKDAKAAATSQNEFQFPEINLADGPGKSCHTVLLKSRSPLPLKFQFSAAEPGAKYISFSPSMGHLGPKGTREVVVTFTAGEAVHLENNAISCSLTRIEYAEEGEGDAAKALQGQWDDSMKAYRKASAKDLEEIATAEAAMKEYMSAVEAEAKKGKKGKPMGPPPPRCLLELGPSPGYVYEIVPEPAHQPVANAAEQHLTVSCSGTADVAAYKCQGDEENILFRPTFLFQSTVYKFDFANLSNLKLPVKWSFEDIKRRVTTRGGGNPSRLSSRMETTSLPPPAVQCPFSIDLDEAEVAPKSDKQFVIKFLPLEAEEFVFLLKGETLLTAKAAAEVGGQPSNALTASAGGGGGGSLIRMVLRGTGKRPICHFDLNETLDYMSRRPSNLKNENGLYSPIESTDLRVVELESCGLQTRNTFRFYVTNPTGDNYEFLWETVGDPSPFWRCVQGAGMMFAGKRIEMVFEYLPEEVSVAESFFKFRIPHLSLEQLFLFTGKVTEPNVSFSTSKVDYHSVMLGGEGSSETIYIENKDHLPFNFVFDKQSLLQLEGPHGPVLNINPKSGLCHSHAIFICI